MHTIVHTIRLRPGVPASNFESWVREVDYATCPQLPSVVRFNVQRISERPDADVHFLEVIEVTSRQAFEQDMTTETFRGLVAEFEQLASVVSETSGARIEPGYARVTL